MISAIIIRDLETFLMANILTWGKMIWIYQYVIPCKIISRLMPNLCLKYNILWFDQKIEKKDYLFLGLRSMRDSWCWRKIEYSTHVIYYQTESTLSKANFTTLRISQWFYFVDHHSHLVENVSSYFSKDSMEGRKEINSPREIILIGGGSGWHFTDRPFATYFGYTPIYQSLATYRLQSK